MPVAEPSIGALLDREIMLSCLADAVRQEPADALDRVFRRGALQVHIRAARIRRVALQQGAEARSMRAPAPVPAEAVGPFTAARGRLATARLVLELRRCDLAFSRSEAAELRASARALRGEAHQIRRRARGA
jgi:hypothetical protein